MGEFSLAHWVILLVIVLIFVGPKKLPGLGKALGETIRGFKKEMNAAQEEEAPRPRQAQQQLPSSETTASAPSEAKKSEKIDS